MPERRKRERRKTEERRKGPSQKFIDGVAKGYFVDERKRDRRRGLRRLDPNGQPPSHLEDYPDISTLTPADAQNLQAWMAKMEAQFALQIKAESARLEKRYDARLAEKVQESAHAAEQKIKLAEQAAEESLILSENEKANLKTENARLQAKLKEFENLTAAHAREIEDLKKERQRQEEHSRQALADLQEKLKLEYEKKWAQNKKEEAARVQIAPQPKPISTPAEAKPSDAGESKPTRQKIQREYESYAAAAHKKNQERQKKGAALVYVFSFEEWLSAKKITLPPQE